MRVAVVVSPQETAPLQFTPCLTLPQFTRLPQYLCFALYVDLEGPRRAFKQNVLCASLNLLICAVLQAPLPSQVV